MKKALLIGAPLLLIVAFLVWNPELLTDETPRMMTELMPQELGLEVTPSDVVQGEPVLISIAGADIDDVRSIVFNGDRLGIFEYKNKPSSLVGIDLNMRSGSYPLIATLKDGTVLKESILVNERVVVEAPLGIPEKLGGNTPEGEANVLNNLAIENSALASLATEDGALWEEGFDMPVSNPFITDEYGYSRLTGASTISHKGTDFRAAVGTPIYAMNSGTVILAREFVIYGKTVVVDHGLGLHTLYMHLSEINVGLGDAIEKGEQIGKSGSTGYAESPHLHISVKIEGVSIDPIKFLDLL
ncbi:MAG: M23 family metallopeptidase [Minisyncoccota bacterium]